MIRPMRSSDRDNVLKVAVKSGLFEEAELEPLAEMLDRYTASSEVENETWLVDDDDGVVGVTYLAHERMTEGTWNMLMLAIHRDHQGQGRGSALVRYCEDLLREQGQRVLLVETSGVGEFEQVRQFYLQNGFARECAIRDFYDDGVDKVIFRKKLQ